MDALSGLAQTGGRASGEVLRLGVVAGEASGDLLGAHLLQGLKARWPGLSGVGIAGPALQAEGVRAWWPSEKLAVRGYVEVLRHYRELVGIRRRLGDRLIAAPPDVFLGIDAPDFNLDLEGRLRARGIPTVHYVAPAVWAWRAERVEQLRRCVDHVLCVFPFEPELLARHGVAASYVGHPLAQAIPLDIDKVAARGKLGLPSGVPVLAVLPGSRAAEIRQLAEPFLQAARQLRRAIPDLHLVLPAVPSAWEGLSQRVTELGMDGCCTVLRGQAHAALAAADVALVASGTATLEAALFKLPMVIAYRMHGLSWWITQRKRLQAWVGLPNILCQEALVPELLQEQATPENLSLALQAWFDDFATGGARSAALRARFGQLHRELRRDTGALAIDAIEQVLAG